MAVDFQNISVLRTRDKASPTRLNLRDRLRSWRLLSNPRIRCGKNVTCKEGVEISICESGSLEIGANAFFHARCWLLLTMPHPTVSIGQWVFMGRETILAAKNKITIGDFTILAPRCYILDHEHGFARDDLILNQRSVLKETHIGRDCYIGTGSKILAGVTINDGAILGAGSVVTKDIPPYQIWAGNPARYLRDR